MAVFKIWKIYLGSILSQALPLFGFCFKKSWLLCNTISAFWRLPNHLIWTHTAGMFYNDSSNLIVRNSASGVLSKNFPNFWNRYSFSRKFGRTFQKVKLRESRKCFWNNSSDSFPVLMWEKNRPIFTFTSLNIFITSL